MMTKNELNTALYNRMLAEQKSYKEELLMMRPEAILNHAFEYAVREKILNLAESCLLSETQAYALLGVDSPLARVYEAYMNVEFKYIEEIHTALDSYATSIAAEHAMLRDQPVYQQSFEYAKAHGETDQYRASYLANVACKEAIERAISKNYSNCSMNRLASAQVVQQFGFDRTLYVLANTVQLKDWDGRFSRSNRDWAKEYQIPGGGDGLRDHRWRFIVDKPHPGLTDMLITMVRRDQEESLAQRSSVRSQLNSLTASQARGPRETARRTTSKDLER